MENKEDLKKLEDKVRNINKGNFNAAQSFASDMLDTDNEEKLGCTAIDFAKIRVDVQIECEASIDSIINLYFDVDTLPDKIKLMLTSRRAMDITSLQALVYQLKTADFAIQEVLNKLNENLTINTSSRLFESLNNLQRTNIVTTKELKLSIVSLQKEYKDLKNILEVEFPSINNTEVNENIKRGTKEMIKEMSDVEEEIAYLNKDTPDGSK